MDTLYIGPMDPPVILYDNDVLRNKHFIAGGNYYGRFLFTDCVMVDIRGSNVLVQNNVFDGNGRGTAINIG